jgi:hypothetical protein
LKKPYPDHSTTSTADRTGNADPIDCSKSTYTGLADWIS